MEPAIAKFRKFIKDEWTTDKRPKGQGETHRWFFCHDQDGGDFDDCGCCLTAPEAWPENCGCNCHHRLGQIEKFIMEQVNEAYEQGRCDALVYEYEE